MLRREPSGRLRLSSSTSRSAPPTISRVGARTRPSAAPARSGRPPREMTAPTSSGRSAAVISAAAAPVLAPNSGERHSGGSLGRGEPVGRVGEPPGQQPDVEPERPRAGVDPLLGLGEQVQQQRSVAGVLQPGGDLPVARAVPAAAAAVGEQDHAARQLRDGEVAGEHDAGGVERSRPCAQWTLSPVPIASSTAVSPCVRTAPCRGAVVGRGVPAARRPACRAGPARSAVRSSRPPLAVLPMVTPGRLPGRLALGTARRQREWR